MVSIVETTAVSLRKGDHSANLGFKGVLAEVVADLGVDGKGTDNNTTLRLHNGVTEGGIPLCRADMLNISTKILAENRQVFNDKNLAYSDLSNIDSELDSRGINTLLSNLRNAGLVTSAELEDYAKKDTSNINTFSLTDPNIHNGITDIRNKPLAYADLSNVTGGLDGLERTSNKVNTITTLTTSAEKYPSTRAVVDYVEDIIIEGSDFLKKDFKNAVSYDVLYSNSSSQIYRYDNSSTNIMDGGVNFVVNTEYYTDQKLNNLEEIQVKVNSIDNNGKPTSISLTMTEGGSNPSFSNNSFIQSDTNEKCYLILTASNVTGYTNVYTFTVAIDTNQTVGTGFVANEIYTINTGSTNPPRSNKLLYVKPTLVNAGGSIESFEYVPSESNTNLAANTLTVINLTGNAIINVISTKTLPDNIYGAKLLKTDLSNLRGMTEEDAQIAMDKAWRIGYHENLPTKDEGIDDSSYLDIATAGMVWNALYNRNLYAKQRVVITTSGITKGVAPSEYKTLNYDFYDSNGTTYPNNTLGMLQCYVADVTGDISVKMRAYKPTTVSGNTQHSEISVNYPVTGDPYTYCQTPVDTISSDKIDNQIATTGWVKQQASKRNIGEIVTSTIPLEDAGLHILNGDILPNEGIYSEFVTYIASLRTDYPNLFTTEAAWQTSNSTYGACGKFVYDSINDRLRLPKIVGFIESTVDLDNIDVGNITEAGLPNHTHGFGRSQSDNNGNFVWNSDNEDYVLGSKAGHVYWNGSGGSAYTTVDPSGSSMIERLGYVYTLATSLAKTDNLASDGVFGNSITVQPQSIKVLYYIVVANTTKTNIQVNIDQIATDLNNKADKNDFVEARVVVETYQNGTDWYRVWSDGWIEQGGSIQVTTTQEYTVYLLKEFSTNHYIALKNYNAPGTGSTEDQQISCYNKTISTFTTQSNVTDTNSFDWYACGYGEIPSI